MQYVIERIAELSSSGPLWLDQLCIVQSDEAIRENLAKIPTIFRTFQVVVLMLDHPCKCLHDFIREVKFQGTHESEDLRSKAFYKCLENYDHCINFTASSSWFRRLWTRQELMYSRSIRCVWASNITPACARKEELGTVDAAHLRPYLALKRQGFLDRGLSAHVAGVMLHSHQLSVQDYAKREIKANVVGPNSVGLGDLLPSYEFLNGAALKNASRIASSSPDPFGQLRWGILLIAQSFDLDLVTRTSTHVQDYVLAVFPDWPLYVVPEEPKTHTMHCLMQDTLNQLHAKEGETFLTTAPQGLFDETSRGSAIWYPDYYHRILQSVKAPSEISFRDVYGPIYPYSLGIPIVNSATPMVLGNSGRASRLPQRTSIPTWRNWSMSTARTKQS